MSFNGLIEKLLNEVIDTTDQTDIATNFQCLLYYNGSIFNFQ